jgi:DNA-binding transcriptional ArsR family regulator
MVMSGLARTRLMVPPSHRRELAGSNPKEVSWNPSAASHLAGWPGDVVQFHGCRMALRRTAGASVSARRPLTRLQYNHMVVSVQIAPPDFDRLFGALADHTRRDIVRRAITAEEGVVELASHYPMSFAAVQKHIAILERAGLVTKARVGRRKVVRTNLERLRIVRRLLDQYEELWRGRIDRMADLIADTKENDR